MTKRFISPVPHVKAMRDVPQGLDEVVTRSLARIPYQDRSGGLIYLHVDPGYAPLRQDPRFAELVARIGLK